jgi:DNA-binding NtrC family response regulator
MFPASGENEPIEFGLDRNGALNVNTWKDGQDLCEAVFNGSMTLDQVEAMLVETAVDKARGNLSSAARLLGLTRPQLAYRLRRLHEGDAVKTDVGASSKEANPQQPNGFR